MTARLTSKWRGLFLRGLLVLLLAAPLEPSLATNPVVARRTLGGRNVINPLTQSGLQVYLNSTTVAGAANSALATWPDLSGNARDATQSTAGQRPIIRDGVSPNGSRMIEFVDANDVMGGTLPGAGTISIAGGMTIYVYCNETSLTTGGFNHQAVAQALSSASPVELITRSSSSIGVGLPDQEYACNTSAAFKTFGAGTVLGAQILTVVWEPPAGASAAATPPAPIRRRWPHRPPCPPTPPG